MNDRQPIRNSLNPGGTRAAFFFGSWPVWRCVVRKDLAVAGYPEKNQIGAYATPTKLADLV